MGIVVPIESRTGFYLGKQNKQLTKRCIVISFALTVFCAIVSTCPAYFARKLLIKIFTHHDDVIGESEISFIYMCMDVIVYFLTSTAESIMTGIGRTTATSVVSTVSLFTLYLPLSWYFGFKCPTFHNNPIGGFWLASGIANFIQFLVYLILIRRTNWQKFIDLAVRRSTEAAEENNTQINDSEEPSETDPLV